MHFWQKLFTFVQILDIIRQNLHHLCLPALKNVSSYPQRCAQLKHIYAQPPFTDQWICCFRSWQIFLIFRDIGMYRHISILGHNKKAAENSFQRLFVMTAAHSANVVCGIDRLQPWSACKKSAREPPKRLQIIRLSTQAAWSACVTSQRQNPTEK